MRVAVASVVLLACGRVGFDHKDAALIPDADPDALVLANLYAEEVLRDSPLAYWRFEAPVQSIDASGNGHHGTFVGATSPATGAFGAGLQIDASGYMQVSSSFRFNDRAPFSLECWLNAAPLSADWSQLFSLDIWNAGGRQGYTIEFRETGVFFVRRRDSFDHEARGFGSLTAGTWHHIVGTYDGTDVRLYVNAQLLEMVAGTTQMATPTDTPLLISHPAFSVRGVVDECAVYGAALPAARVQAHFAMR